MMESGSFFVLDGPLAPAPAAMQTRSAHLKGFSTIVRNLGHNPARILDKHGIDQKAILNEDFYVDCSSLVDLIGQCSADLDQPLFGLMLAKQQSTHVLGTLESLCRAAPDFRTALDSFCENISIVHSPQCMLEHVTTDSTTELRMNSRSDFEFLEQMIYGGFLTNITFLRELGGREFAPKYVTTKYRPSPKVTEQLEDALMCKVHTGREHDAIGFSSGILDKPLPSANRITFTLLGEYLNRVHSQQRHSLIERVEDYIRGAISGECTLRRCAAALGMNSRALQISLNDFDVSFSDLVMAQRARLAQEYVLSGEFTLDEIAAKLGYAEQTSFGRAFRRWTGSTPGKFKATPRGAIPS